MIVFVSTGYSFDYFLMHIILLFMFTLRYLDHSNFYIFMLSTSKFG